MEEDVIKCEAILDIIQRRRLPKPETVSTDTPEKLPTGTDIAKDGNTDDDRDGLRFQMWSIASSLYSTIESLRSRMAIKMLPSTTLALFSFLSISSLLTGATLRTDVHRATQQGAAAGDTRRVPLLSGHVPQDGRRPSGPEDQGRRSLWQGPPGESQVDVQQVSHVEELHTLRREAGYVPDARCAGSRGQDGEPDSREGGDRDLQQQEDTHRRSDRQHVQGVPPASEGQPPVHTDQEEGRGLRRRRDLQSSLGTIGSLASEKIKKSPT